MRTHLPTWAIRAIWFFNGMAVMWMLGCATTDTRYAVEYRADATRPAEGVIVAGVSGGFSSVRR